MALRSFLSLHLQGCNAKRPNLEPNTLDFSGNHFSRLVHSFVASRCREGMAVRPSCSEVAPSQKIIQFVLV